MTDKMRIWDALKTTDPKFTKPVTFGRKFTSINSQWQLQRMTEQFGAVGKGWGYDVVHSVERITDDYVLAIADVRIWWLGEADKSIGQMPASRPQHVYGPVRGMSPIVERGKSGLHVDDDAGKKAMTDALTKGLSHLGLSSDVFLGLFDDNKYVHKVAAQFREGDRPAQIMHGLSPTEIAQADAEQRPIDAVDPADRDLVKGNGEQSQYDVNKRKQAEDFLQKALAAFSTVAGGSAVSDWYNMPISPKGKSTNRDAAERLKEQFPDLGDKLEVAADNARARFA